jgi:FHS family L-fucose permease-like MFS transporter
MEKNTTPTNYGALTTLTTVFFFWGFIAAGNSIFIPFCRHYFDLDQFQSQLIDFAFYGAYYLGALGLFCFGTVSGKDLVGTWGYKRSIVYGLLFSALGAVAMIVSVYTNVFAGMLFGLFIVALGFSLQQTSANPFMISLGDEATGSNRINLGGSINSLGTSFGPVIISLALFGTTSAISDEMIASLSLSKVIILYTVVGCLFLGVAALFGFSKKVPSGKVDELPHLVSNDNLLDDGTIVPPKPAAQQQVERARKALVTLLVITGLLITCFTPVFSSYRSDEVKQIQEIHGAMDKITGETKAFAPEHLTKQQIITFETLDNRAHAIAHKLDQERMIWLSAGIVVVLGGMLFANRAAKRKPEGWGAMRYPQLTMGMVAIFVYVGVEVAIGSNLGELLRHQEFGGYSSSEITPFVSMFWGSLMIGRWAGSINAFQFSANAKLILRFIVPLVAFGVVLGFARLNGYDISPLYWYILCVLVQIAAFYLTKDKPALTLTVFGFLGIAATLIGLTTTGIVAVYAFLSAGLFCSIMWPCIFSLSLAGLGKYQAQGAAFLVMMILGGAIIPPLQGKLSDIVGIQGSFFVGTVCFFYITIFAIYVNRLLKKQGVSLDESEATH